MATRAEIQARLAFWQAALNKMQAAYLALVEGGAKSYSIGDRTLTKFDIPQLTNEIQNTERKVDELSAMVQGRKPRKAFGIIPRDC